MSDSTKSYSSDPTLWLYTSLSSGSSHIVTATSRLETILKANRIPFQALDVATDEKARMLWGRRAGKRKLPGLVKQGMVVGDLEEVEEWNEYGEIEENLGPRDQSIYVAPGFKSSSAAPAPAPKAKPAAGAVPTAILPPAAPPAAPPMPDPKAPPPPIQVSQTSNPTSSAQASPAVASPVSPSVKEDKPNISGQMRSMGAEVAEKAKQMRSAKLKAMAAGTSTTKTDGSRVEDKKDVADSNDAAPQDDTTAGADASKSEDSAAKPPLSGETPAEDAIALETAGAKVEPEADDVPQTSKDAATSSPEDSKVVPDSAAVESTSSLPIQTKTQTEQRGSNITEADKEDIKKVEESTKIEEVSEEDEDEDEEEDEDEDASEKGKEASRSGTEAKVAESPNSPVDQEKASKASQSKVQDKDKDKDESEEEEKEKVEEKDQKPVKSETESTHVKFGGEAQGEEIDRVKTTLEQSAANLEAETSPPSSPNKKEHARMSSIDAATKKDSEGTKAADMVSSDKAEDPAGTKTQEQKAADPEKAESSVAD